MFTQCGKTGDDDGEIKDKNQKHQRNLDRITSNDCGEKDTIFEKMSALQRQNSKRIHMHS